jgi:Protein of unknown function (DUF2800)
VSDHATFAPSGSHRWLNCSGSLALAKDLPPQETNVYAADGTLTHWIAEAFQTSSSDLSEWGPGTEHVVEGFHFTVDQERLDRVQWYVDAGAREPGLKFYEVKLDMRPVYGIPGQFGTADRVIANLESATLTVDDLKDGVGRVTCSEARGSTNWQLVSYALAALFEFDYLTHWDQIRVRIFQPKLDWADEQTYTRAELLALGAKLATAAQKAERQLDGREPVSLKTGPWCRWCPAAGSCPQLAKESTDDIPDALHTSRLSEDALGALLRREPEVLSAFAAFRAEATARARMGSRIPGYALTTGREGPRKWASETAVEAALNKLLAGDAYKRALIGPPEAEKRLKKVEGGKDVWVAMQSHIIRSPGELRLAPEAEVPNPLTAAEFNFSDVRSGTDGLI